MTTISKVLAISVGAGLVAVAQVHADPLIVGTIAFNGKGTPFTMNNTGTTLANATKFTSITADVGATTGSYNNAAHGGTGPLDTSGFDLRGSGSVTFTDFTFVPTSAPPPELLWTFTDDGYTYSFTMDTMTAMFSPGADTWTFGGTGFAAITGYADTAGVWTLSASESSATAGGHVNYSFVFDSSAVVAGTPVPDGGLTVMMLGGAFLAIGALRKKFKA